MDTYSVPGSSVPMGDTITQPMTALKLRRGSSTYSLNQMNLSQEPKKKANTRVIVEAPMQYQLDVKPHYEDEEPDQMLKRLVPQLRKYTI